MPLLSFYQHLVARRYTQQSDVDQSHRVTTPDGVALWVKRFVPKGFVPKGFVPKGFVPKVGAAKEGVPRHHHPVLCVPGLGADSHNFDAPAPNGLCRYLADHGFDTWVLDLRGTGQSDVARADWPLITFDDFVNFDLPAVLSHITQVTGCVQVHWVGHSMGGMLAYALLGTRSAEKIRSLVTIGSTVGFPQGWSALPQLRPLRAMGTYLPGVQVAFLMRYVAPFLARTHLQPGLRTLLEFDNIDPAYLRRVAFKAVQDIPRGVLLQFRDWIHCDAFRSADKTVDYRAGMVGAACPTLVVSGPADKLGARDGVERALHLLGNATALHCAKSEGFTADYGHIDLIFGKNAPDEIFPRLDRFLTQEDQPQQRQPALRLVEEACANGSS